MARSLPASALSRLDLPALGRPMMATLRPSFKRKPRCASRRSSANAARRLSSCAAMAGSARKSISSSGKSIAASMCTRKAISALQQRLDLAREHAFHRLQGGACAGLRARGDQVSDRFGLGQVEFAVEECALGEFAGAGQPRAEFADAAQQQVEQHRAAVTLQLQHMFAGVGGRRREVQQQAAVDQLAGPVTERGEMRVARLRRAAEQDLARSPVPPGRTRAGHRHRRRRARWQWRRWCRCCVRS